ncbi:MAG TPA: M14 family metallopeptidase, partial [Vicinamibacterales bacterium]|nr:M14 family metallopeptidase [Vicinamibacterales bacterium]
MIGFKPGADFKLATYDDTIKYFRALDAASAKMQLVPMGTSTQGRTYYVALISTERNLARVDRYREIARRLASPEGLTEDQARALAREGKAVVHIDGGLHSTEVAGPQHTLQLAYDLLTTHPNEPGRDEQVQRILENVVLMLWPTINPDGHQMVAEHYMKNVGTPGASTSLPVLYQEYVGHDNNRDAYMLNMIESRVMEQAWRQWEPQIVYVHHQTAPFPTRIWLPPFAEPIALHAPFLMSRTVNTIGMAIAQGLEERGQVGATHMGTGFDAWYAGYIDYTPMFKNIASFWTETALANMAAPRDYTIKDIPQAYQDLRPQSLYASPWAGGHFGLGDSVAYMHTASMSVLDYAAKYKDNVLMNRWRSGMAQITQHRASGPSAYVVPKTQRDPVAAVEMLKRIAFGGVRVSELTADFTVGDVTYAAGSWVVPTDQEFIALAREVLDVQKYPDIRESPGGAPEQPYDAAGWTLPLSMGVAMQTVGAVERLDVPAQLSVTGFDDLAL